MLDFFLVNWVEIVGAALGVLYLYFEYKADLKMWPTGILMSSFYVYVFIVAKFYAFTAINIYYIIVGFYGWIQWNKSKNENNSVTILSTPKRYYLPILGISTVVFFIVAYCLKTFTDSPVPYPDSFVTTLSLVAMCMLAQRWAEQWILLIAHNTFSIFLYYWQDLYPTSIMYLIYSVVSIFGYIRWRKLAKNKLKENENI